MIYQIRTYTISGGMIDQWLKFFKETNLPIMEKYGLKLEGAWVNEARNQVIWMRSAKDADDLKAKEARFLNSPEWKAASPQTRNMVARMEVQLLESVTGS
jgi:hypothetical protein